MIKIELFDDTNLTMQCVIYVPLHRRCKHRQCPTVPTGWHILYSVLGLLEPSLQIDVLQKTCVFSYDNVLRNLCVSASVYVREGEREWERHSAAKARSPDVIEEDISDYPKDRNLSLSMIYLQLFLSCSILNVCIVKVGYILPIWVANEY